MALARLVPLLLAALLLTGQAPAGPATTTVGVAIPGGAPATVDLAALPAAEAMLTLGNPPAAHTFRGPLLWTVLLAAQRVDPARHADAVRQTIRLQGSDGYVAVLAAGELAPEFANHPVLLALRMDGQPLQHPRAVVPGDHRPGRSVHDVVLVTLDELPKSRP